MSLVFAIAAVVLAVLLCFTTLIQTLYLESLRLRTRDLESLQFFKNELQDRIGLKTEQGALSFSLIKHIALSILGVVVLLGASWHATHVWQGAVASLLLAPGIMFASAYVVPQFLYRKTTLAWFRPLIPAAKALAAVIAPLAWLLNFLYSLSELGSEPEETSEEAGAAENIEALITAGEEEGIIEEDDRKLIQSVVAFGDKTVREVMTPRPNIVAIEASKPLEALRDLVLHERFSRIPVYESDIDQMIGFVHVRDMFELSEDERAKKKVRDLVRPLEPVPETKPVNDLLREMQDLGNHLAVVVDEYGNTAGLVTMEDLVEVIVGEIHDEHEPERDIEEESPGVYVASGSFDVDRLNDLFQFRPNEDTEATTVGGLVTEWLGRVPAVGETVEREGLRIEVLAGNNRRVESVRLCRASAPTAAPAPDGDGTAVEQPAAPQPTNGDRANGRK